MDNRNFLDFTEFFSLLKDSMPPSFLNEEVFEHLLAKLYRDAERSPGSIKDEVSDILRKRKPFHSDVRKLAKPQILDAVVEDLTENTRLLKWIIQPRAFIDRLLFRVRQDTFFFGEADYIKLDTKRDNPAYIIAYVLIRTVATSNETKNLRHSADYNPFAEYHLPVSAMQETYPESNVRKTLVQTSRYLYDELTAARQSSPRFRSELLSNGITYDHYPRKFDFSSTFSITESSPESKSLDSFLQTSNHLLVIGEGGIGKTTFLYSCLEKHHSDGSYPSIPLYIKLSDCSTSTDHQYIIQNTLHKKISFAVNGNAYISFRDFRDEFAKPCAPDEMPGYTLLLDGFNEITTMDFGEIRRAISNEIIELLTFPNVRVILTSRENDFYNIPLARFQVIRANGIGEKDVISYLQTIYPEAAVNEISSNHVLMQYLKIPLFLLMYTNSSHSEVSAIASRGSILFAYFNSSHSFYNEKINTEEKTTREAYLMVSVLLDFLLPDLGYYMKSQNLFQISEDMLQEHISHAVNSARRFIGLHADAYSRYDQHPNTLRRALNSFSSKLDEDDILSLLRDYLCVIISDANRNLSFTHQYIRDYFSALYCVREFYYMTSIAKRQPDQLSNIDLSWGSDLWDEDQISLVQEILSLPSEFQKTDLIYDTIDLFRSSHHYAIPETKYALSNLISVLALANNGDLFRYDFSYLDLSNCTLANYNFHDVLDGRSSSFFGAKIGMDTFSTDAHNNTVLKWSLSDDGQFIISISADLELKVWNITTQKCITTRQCPRLNDVDSINNLELLNQGTLALITYQDKEKYSFSSATYDFNEELYTLYLLPNTDPRNITYFGYDTGTNTLISILSNGWFYRYNVNEETPVEEFCLLIKRPRDISYFRILAVDKLLYWQDDFLYLYHLSSGHSEKLGELSPTSLNRVMVNRDKTIIATETEGVVHVCYMTQPAPRFRHLASFSPDELYAIRFCHDDPNILTFYSYGVVYHLDCITGEVLFYTSLESVTDFFAHTITHNYRIIELEDTPTAELQLTNLYTKVTSVFRLSNRQHLIGTYIDHKSNTFHGFYNNGTLMSFDADTLQLRRCFNYAPGRYVSTAVYSEQDNLLCFASTPSHYYLYSRQSQITLVDLTTGMCRKSAPIFDPIGNIRFINAQQILIFSMEDILLIDTETFTVKTSCPQHYKYNRDKNHIFIDGRNIHITSDFGQIIGHVEYDASVATYIIDEQDNITLNEITYVPCPWQFIEHCPLIYSVLDSTGLALIKAVKFSERTYMTYRSYKYTTKAESYFLTLFGTRFKYELMNDWVLSSLGNSHAPFGRLPVSEAEMQVDEKFFNPTGDNIVCKGNSYYEHRMDTDEYILLDWNLFTSMERLNYSSQTRTIYYHDRHSSSIHKYDIDGHRTTATSNYLYPHILVYGCDFGRCTGELNSVPWYMVKNQPKQRTDHTRGKNLI